MHEVLQQLLVTLIVVLAAGYVFWAIAGNLLRLRVLKAAWRAVPPLRGRIDTLRRRLESPTGCSACRRGSV